MGATFSSDNAAGASAEIVAAVAAAGLGAAPAYGEDLWTERIERRFCEIFERPVDVFPVISGTAANALSLAAAVPPFGAVLTHTASHIETDECGAPEFYTGGAKLLLVGGRHGKIDPAELEKLLATAPRGVHWAPRSGLSLSQATEAGTVYRPEEIRVLAGLAHAQGLAVHLDGARFANAVAALGVTPAEASWRAGVDILSFGATKNGALAAEAIIVFEPRLAKELGHRRKRGGHLLSKLRFISAQLEAYLDNDLWLANARHANAQAARLLAGIEGQPGVALLHPVEANILFVALTEAVAQGLADDGFKFYRWPDAAGRVVIRLVASFATTAAEVDDLLAALRSHLAAADRP